MVSQAGNHNGTNIRGAARQVVRGEEGEHQRGRVDLLRRVERARLGVGAGPGVAPVLDRVERDRRTVGAARPGAQRDLARERAQRRTRTALVELRPVAHVQERAPHRAGERRADRAVGVRHRGIDGAVEGEIRHGLFAPELEVDGDGCERGDLAPVARTCRRSRTPRPARTRPRRRGADRRTVSSRPTPRSRRRTRRRFRYRSAATCGSGRRA